MSKLDELIKEYCRGGVEHKPLWEIFEQFSGMTGVSNKWADSGNCQFIDYMNVYKNPVTDISALKNATVKSLNQNMLKKGDILFTGASEKANECAIVSEIEGDIKNNVFMDDHLFALRVKEHYKSQVATGYLKYAFGTSEFRTKLLKAVRGVTRFYVSKTDFMNLEIPLPPLPVQEEIVRILDTFSELEAELEAERIQRIKQYDYYRNLLLDFGNPEIINLSHTIFEQVRKLCPNGVEHKKLSDVCFKITDGMHNLPKTITTDGKYPIISAQNINNGYISLNTSKYVDEKTFILENKRTNVKKNDVLLTIVGAIGRVAKVSSDMEVLLQRSVCVLKPNPNILDSQFLKYVLESEQPQKYIKNYAHGAAQKGIYLDNVSKIKIPIPPIEIQKEIVKILDHLSGLCNNVVMGIPAEINSRRMQYEYYRNVLLSFDNSMVAGTEQNRTEQNRTEQNRTEQNRTEQNRLTTLLSIIKHLPLGDVVNILDSDRKPITKQYRKFGIYPYYGANGIQDYIDGFIFDGTYLLVGEDGSVVNDNNNPITTWVSGKIWVNNHAHVLSEKNICSLRYLYHYLNTVNVSSLVRGTPPKLNQENLRNILVPIPTKEEQNYIVEILDKLEKLCYDFSEGIPAEIGKLRQQYEYYRNKLLTFEEKKIA